MTVDQITDNANAAAELGAQAFDVIRPGWAFDIDRNRLNVNSTRDCPVGQLFGNWVVHRDKVLSQIRQALGRDVKPVDVGLVVPFGPNVLTRKDAVNAAWDKQVAARTRVLAVV